MADAAPPHAPPAITPSGGALYWRAAYWLTALLTVFTIAQIAIQFRLNLWSHDFFNAFERHDGATLQVEALLCDAGHRQQECRRGAIPRRRLEAA